MCLLDEDKDDGFGQQQGIHHEGDRRENTGGLAWTETLVSHTKQNPHRDQACHAALPFH